MIIFNTLNLVYKNKAESAKQIFSENKIPDPKNIKRRKQNIIKACKLKNNGFITINKGVKNGNI